MLDFQTHIYRRDERLYNISTTILVVDYYNEIVTFKLYSPDLILKAKLEYHWKGSKKAKNSGKYISYNPNPKLNTIAVFLLKDLDIYKPIYIVEGVWDAISIASLAYQVVAVLSTNINKETAKWIRYLPNTIAVCDGDKAGLSLANYTTSSIQCPEGQDPNSMKLLDLLNILNQEGSTND